MELIIIDDCSTDNTEEVVKYLQSRHSRIKYIRNDKNSKQGFAKNVGIENAKGTYIYFGDDDSVITNDSIRILLGTLHKYKADCVGARALYAGNYVDPNNLEIYINWKNMKDVCRPDGICNLEKMETNFHCNCLIPVQVPILPSCALVKSDIAHLTKFDINYRGCAYCEETDFFIRIKLAGYKIVFQPNAVQVNMPQCLVGNSGAHVGGYLKWQKSAIQCSNYFLDKNWESICKYFNFNTSKKKMQDIFSRKIYLTAQKMHTENIIKTLLKKIYFKYIICPRYCRKNQAAKD
jgi:glycosyltransferase involved in cell wall biosynthesis